MSTLPSPSEGGGDFAPPPAGSHMAICYRVLDLGTQRSTFKGEEKEQHKVMLSWELRGEDALMKEGPNAGKPMSVHQRYTWSMYENAILRQHLESWRGKKFTEADFGPAGFNIMKLLNVACMLSIVHEPGKRDANKVFANVKGISALPAVLKPNIGTLVNPTAYLWLSPEGWNPQVFAGLSESLQNTIKKSPEYLQVTTGKTGGKQSSGSAVDDEIPF